jgi:hypothetical protein
VGHVEDGEAVYYLGVVYGGGPGDGCAPIVAHRDGGLLSGRQKMLRGRPSKHAAYVAHEFGQRQPRTPQVTI